MTKKGNPLGNPPAASSSDDDDDEADSSAGDEEEVNDSSSEEEEEENQPKPPSSSAKTDSESDTKKEKSPPPATKSGTKWPSEGISKETNSKRAKKDDEKKIGEDSKKPAAFQRLWTEEDEIAVLQGMIDFKKDTGNSPYDDTNAYYDYIKKSISFEVSKNQFMDKLRSLKKKYMGKEKPSCWV
ncbi:probable transcription factor At1g61730 [Brassica napus]|uniref:probable transcription factor At1g61730 n=1 Tax=Brassica napus TaxID=3708 RepID=UPI00207885B7|nr:probable transcription factor At1g61730 [Brassica napus]